jgi:hypothetical protein
MLLAVTIDHITKSISGPTGLQDMAAHAHRLAAEHHYKQGHQILGATSVVQNAARNGAGSPSTARAGRPDACARNEGELPRGR